MKITACPKCGSMFIKTGSISDGILYGITSKYVCEQCGYQGMPLEFESEKSYKLYLKELEKTKKIIKEKKSKKIGDKTDIKDLDEKIHIAGISKSLLLLLLSQ